MTSDDILFSDNLTEEELEKLLAELDAEEEKENSEIKDQSFHSEGNSLEHTASPTSLQKPIESEHTTPAHDWISDLLDNDTPNQSTDKLSSSPLSQVTHSEEVQKSLTIEKDTTLSELDKNTLELEINSLISDAAQKEHPEELSAFQLSNTNHANDDNQTLAKNPDSQTHESLSVENNDSSNSHHQPSELLNFELDIESLSLEKPLSLESERPQPSKSNLVTEVDDIEFSLEIDHEHDQQSSGENVLESSVLEDSSNTSHPNNNKIDNQTFDELTLMSNDNPSLETSTTNHHDVDSNCDSNLNVELKIENEKEASLLSDNVSASVVETDSATPPTSLEAEQTIHPDNKLEITDSNDLHQQSDDMTENTTTIDKASNNSDSHTNNMNNDMNTLDAQDDSYHNDADNKNTQNFSNTHHAPDTVSLETQESQPERMTTQISPHLERMVVEGSLLNSHNHDHDHDHNIDTSDTLPSHSAKNSTQSLSSAEGNQTEIMDKMNTNEGNNEELAVYLKTSKQLQDTTKQIHAQIHYLKNQLRLVSDTFRDMADTSANMIADTRQLQNGCADDFSISYEQMHELRRQIIKTRQHLGDLPSLLDLVEEAMESDLYVAETRHL